MHYTLYTIPCVYTIHYTLYLVYTLYTIQYTLYLVHPFCPLRIKMSIRLLVFRFKNTDSLAISVPDEVTTATTLVYPLW